MGKYLVEELKREEPEVKIVVWDRVVGGLPEGVEGIEIDITKPASYRESLRLWQPEWVAHLAAVSSVGASLKDPKQTFRINVEGTRHLLEEIEEGSPDTKVLAVSTSDIYGQGSDTPLSELVLNEAQPRSPYAQSKWEMEKLIEERFLKNTLRVRPFPHIGPGQALGFVTADFASQIAGIEKREQAPTIKVGNLKAKRDFTDVRDVVRAYRLLMKQGQLGEVYHVASGKTASIQFVLDELLKLSKVDIEVEQDPERMRPADIPVLVGDAGKLKEAVGWKPVISLKQSLDDILNYWRER